mmetsp:Transcript_30544/g.93358  ORF Transcript_30544/g.93358 Transcript_30544/m.93358 type:complete len:204 (-) Transcript_30544:21-632(-)
MRLHDVYSSRSSSRSRPGCAARARRCTKLATCVDRLASSVRRPFHFCVSACFNSKRRRRSAASASSRATRRSSSTRALSRISSPVSLRSAARFASTRSQWCWFRCASHSSRPQSAHQKLEICARTMSGDVPPNLTRKHCTSHCPQRRFKNFFLKSSDVSSSRTSLSEYRCPPLCAVSCAIDESSFVATGADGGVVQSWSAGLL